MVRTRSRWTATWVAAALLSIAVAPVHAAEEDGSGADEAWRRSDAGSRFGVQLGPAGIYMSGGAGLSAGFLGVLTCRVHRGLGVRASGGTAFSPSQIHSGGNTLELTPRWGELAGYVTASDGEGRLLPWVSVGLAVVATSLHSESLGMFTGISETMLQPALSLAAGLGVRLTGYLRLQPQVWLAVSPSSRVLVMGDTGLAVANRGRLTGAATLALELAWR